MQTRVTSATKEVIIGDGRPTVLIGERINPAGRKSLAESLKAGSMDVIRQEAVEQVQAGADILDVNATVFGTDEVTLLPQVVKTVTEAVDVPLCIDSANPDALQAALKVCTGHPLINSVSGEEHSLNTVLPIVKEFGTAVVGLLQDDEGIPRTVEKRVAIANKIVARVESYGIPKENIVIDCLALAVGADPGSCGVTLETIRRIKSELGINTTLAVSNVSFGMPDRGMINSVFATMAVAAGATCLILDVARLRPYVLAADLALERDRLARRYLGDYRKRHSEQ